MRWRALARPFFLAIALGVLGSGAQPADAASNACLGDAPAALGDVAAITATRAAIDAACPCASFDGSAGKNQRKYRRCAKQVIDTMIGAGKLRQTCRGKVRRMSAKSTCGYAKAAKATVCVRQTLATGVIGCTVVTPAGACRAIPGVQTTRRCSAQTHCIDAADTNGDLRIAAPGDNGRCAKKAAAKKPAPAPTPNPGTTPSPYATGPDGKRLAELINAYRVAHGKRALPISRTMSTVAAAHVDDLVEHPSIDSGACVPHSWSKQSGLWSGCCYTVDHANASCMWDKPREISAGLGMIQYTGSGYEIALRGFEGNTPEQVVEAFAGSAPHRAVMLTTSGWEFLEARGAIGAAMRGKYSVVWFGDQNDPN
jgi:hypothetical protein